MRIPLDRGCDTPLYQQIMTFLRTGIQTGGLSAETRLPSTRQLARDIGVNRITVDTAYAELEADGLVYTRVGSGTYVLPYHPLQPLPKEAPGAPWPLWQQEIQARNEQHSKVSPDELLRVRAAGQSHPLSFAGGIGDSRLFPVQDFRKVIQAVFRRDGTDALEYGEKNGYGPLRETIAHVLASQGLQTHADNILITAGSQQAIALIGQTLLRPGDTILVESPTYASALDLFRTQGLKIVGIPLDQHGMLTDRLEKLLQQHHPKLIYTIPNFQNPTGACLSLQRRHTLLALADRYNVPILEDDFVGDLRYDGRALPSLKALDPGGRVIYVSTFSKMLMPGLRVGFLAAEGPVYTSLVECKRVNDLTTSNLYQRAVEAYVTVGRYEAHLRQSCHIYRKRRDVMLQAIDRYLPEGTAVTPPQGGLFVWVRLPAGISTSTLLPLACDEGVSFSPGSMFFPDPAEGEDCMRLNFVTQLQEDIEEGMRRLARAIKRL